MKNNNLDKIGVKFKSADIENYDSSSRTISGYAAVFNNVDRDGDILLKGCFAKSIADRGPHSDAKGKILLLWQHEQHNPIGQITELREDEKGLYFEAAIDEIAEGDRAIQQLESGTLNQFSIGFSYVWDKCYMDTTDNGDEFLAVGEVKLYEISVVSIAANPETEFLGMKSEDKAGIEDAISHFAKGLPINEQYEFLKIISAVKSLSAAMPQEVAHVEDKAEETRNSVFDIFANKKD